MGPSSWRRTHAFHAALLGSDIGRGFAGPVPLVPAGKLRGPKKPRASKSFELRTSNHKGILIMVLIEDLKPYGDSNHALGHVP